MQVFYLTSVNKSAPPPEAAQLEAWIAALAGGAAPLADIYKATSAAVYSFALSLTKNQQDAEDVLHDCYLNLYSAASSYRPNGKPLAWLLTITKNLCLMKKRVQKRTQTLPDEDWSRLFSDDYLPEREDDRIMLAGCLGQLSDDERQIVILHSISGFKHRETAELLSMPLATVISKYNRAIKKMATSLTKGEEYYEKA